MTRSWAGRTWWVAVSLGICTGVVSGQAPAPQFPGCNGEIISRIDVEALPPFEPGGSRIVARAARIATRLHATTRPSVILRYLALQVGQPCSTLRVRESERILRAQPFIADANIVAMPDGTGGVAISVVTTDEISLVLDASGSGKSPMLRALRVGDGNINGAGIAGSVAWQHGEFYRDTYKARLMDYQFLGHAYQLSLQGSRNEIGGSWDALLSHPFFTDLQRVSWRASAGSNTGYLHFKRTDRPDAALQFTRSYADVGGVVGLGRVGRVFLLGATLSRESERTGRFPVLVTDSGVVPDASPELVGRYGTHQSSRANVLIGFRHIQFMRVRGFDAIEGAQDVRTGVQAATLIGRGFKISPQDARDFFMSADVYAGGGSPTSFTGIEVMSERRRDLDTGRWDGILASGRAAWYLKQSPRQTSVVSFEYSGGWRQRVPFQVTLGDREGGLRGYHGSDLGGGQRLIARMEDRVNMGHIRQFAGVAGAAFVDAGKLWAGTSPFGVSTNIKFSAGVGLLAALPPRSRRTWRVDLAFPLNNRGDAGRYEVRFTNHDFTRWFWREPGDVQTSRERSIPNSVYNWP